MESHSQSSSGHEPPECRPDRKQLSGEADADIAEICAHAHDDDDYDAHDNDDDDDDVEVEVGNDYSEESPIKIWNPCFGYRFITKSTSSVIRDASDQFRTEPSNGGIVDPQSSIDTTNGTSGNLPGPSTAQAGFTGSSELHTEKEVHRCNMCNAEFVEKMCLLKHLSIEHTFEVRFPCNSCSKTFKTESLLNTHLITHTGEKSHECEICQKEFGLRSTLKKHYGTHVIFQCPICNRVCSIGENIRRHIREHEQATPSLLIHAGEKSHECVICHMKFSRHYKLMNHYQIHVAEEGIFRCPICNRVCSNEEIWRGHIGGHEQSAQHLLAHTSKKPHVCVICHKKFVQRYRLMKHYQTHLAENVTFQCPICNGVCPNGEILRRHIREHDRLKK